MRAGSIASELGLAPGDRLYEIGGTRPRDYIDYRFLAAEPVLEVRILRPDGEDIVFEIEKDPDEDLGLEFTEDIFGGAGPKRCANRCLFCFVDRLPPGLRPALYLKDDDFRLSFLHGNFITLTNLTDADHARIAAQRLSPLYVSVHATEPRLRSALMGTPTAGKVVSQMKRLIRAGVTLHAQVVVCPGLNDGEHLQHTLGELAALAPGVASVGVVPVGLTRFGPAATPVRPLTAQESERLLATSLEWHNRLGGFVYPADELFLAQGRPVPERSFYGDFPQLQNGIGLARVFLDDLGRTRRRLNRRGPGLRGGPRGRGEAFPEFLVVTSGLAAELVEQAVKVAAEGLGLSGRVLVVANGFFGPTVTVAGLLSGEDIARAVERFGAPTRDGAAPGPVLVPSVALRAGSDEFLDGLTLGDLGRRTGRVFRASGWLPSQMAETLEAWAAEEPAVGKVDHP